MKQIYRIFCKVEEAISCTLFFAMVVLVLCSALARLIGRPLAWSIDVAQLMLAWTCFLGADVAYRRGKLVGLDLFTRNLPKKIQELLTLIIQVIILVALVIFVIYGFNLSIESWERSFQTLTISYSFVTLSLPVSSILLIITDVLKIKDTLLILAGKKERQKAVVE